uniref:Uncharacterized protein n=1 Tax=Steinernema glaseri TaxID=37863 RepID=A0A1I8AWC1_9BILA
MNVRLKGVEPSESTCPEFGRTSEEIIRGAQGKPRTRRYSYSCAHAPHYRKKIGSPCAEHYVGIVTSTRSTAVMLKQPMYVDADFSVFNIVMLTLSLSVKNRIFELINFGD